MDDVKRERRRALKVVAVASGVAGCGALALPTSKFVVAPASSEVGGGRWIGTVPIESLSDGKPTRVALVADRRDAWTLEKHVELGAAWLVRSGSTVRAWSTTCPHLGCAVGLAAGRPGFYCPCHDSTFAADGRRLAGPSPRDLDSLEARVDGGRVLVEFRRFRQGTPDKTPIG